VQLYPVELQFVVQYQNSATSTISRQVVLLKYRDEYTIGYLAMNLWRGGSRTASALLRPAAVEILVGDATKAAMRIARGLEAGR